MNEIIIDMNIAEKRFAVKENGVVTRLYIEQPSDASEVGNIYFGKVASVKKGINAAFVNIGKEKNGFLQKDQLPSYIHSNDPKKEQAPISKFITEGEKLLVQVKKDETGTKGVLLTAIIEIPGERSVYMPEGKYVAISKKAEEKKRNQWRKLARQHKQKQEGFIIRTEAFSGTEEDWLHEVEQLRKSYASIVQKKNKVKAPALLMKKSFIHEEIIRELTRLKSGVIDCNDRDIVNWLKEQLTDKKMNWDVHFHMKKENVFAKHQLENEVEKAQKQIVWLDKGAYIVINETEAAVIIDVNTGKFTGKQVAAETVVQTNIIAAREIARQLRIRDYGGMILIDFIDMESNADRRKVQQTLEELLQQDPKQTRAVGFTPLGIFEVTRKRTKRSLPKTLQTKCRVCHGSGQVESPETVAFRLERELFELPTGEHDAILIEMDKDTESVFVGEGNRHLYRLEALLQMEILIKIIPSSKFEYFIRQFGTSTEIKRKLLT